MTERPKTFLQTIFGGADKIFVSSFMKDAEEIFQVASRSTAPEELTIRVTPGGGIFVTTGLDYSGGCAGTTYRVRRGQGVTEVEARNGAQTCRLRQEPAGTSWMTDRPKYLAVETRGLGA